MIKKDEKSVTKTDKESKSILNKWDRIKSVQLRMERLNKNYKDGGKKKLGKYKKWKEF